MEVTNELQQTIEQSMRLLYWIVVGLALFIGIYVHYFMRVDDQKSDRDC